MALTYKTRDGDTVDAVAWRYYGSQSPDVLRLVLEANPGLADRGAVLPSGLDISLPEIVKPTSLKKGVTLWT